MTSAIFINLIFYPSKWSKKFTNVHQWGVLNYSKQKVWQTVTLKIVVEFRKNQPIIARMGHLCIGNHKELMLILCYQIFADNRLEKEDMDKYSQPKSENQTQSQNTSNNRNPSKIKHMFTKDFGNNRSKSLKEFPNIMVFSKNKACHSSSLKDLTFLCLI